MENEEESLFEVHLLVDLEPPVRRPSLKEHM